MLALFCAVIILVKMPDIAQLLVPTYLSQVSPKTSSYGEKINNTSEKITDYKQNPTIAFATIGQLKDILACQFTIMPGPLKKYSKRNLKPYAASKESLCLLVCTTTRGFAA